MDRLFEVGATGDRCCRTCAHAAMRHGVIRRGTYPLVCLMKAAPVPSERAGAERFDFPCGVGMDGGEWYPRGWSPR